jgi:hypothetical protein
MEGAERWEAMTNYDFVERRRRRKKKKKLFPWCVVEAGE